MKSTTPIETEIKLYVPDLPAVQVRLEQRGAYLSAARVLERNARYDDAAQSLTARGEVLRLRQDTRIRLTYKAEKAVVDGISSRIELETAVADYAAMDGILGAIGFRPYLVYEKYRTTYTLDGAEVVLDELPYGNFVEIEGERVVIEALLEQLGLTAAPRFGESYTVLFERVKQHLGLACADLTFANFAGVVVPPSAFLA